ncbi:hypothetical protein LCGC14_0272200 [marine sediment metagenome]|uniref:YqcC-like domain-containing protein n=1 Tax=marine sediment metagenome TaxID=412755 RepID=A0A0F9TYB8_9ZZZZ
MTDELWQELADAILDLQQELRLQGLWAQHAPSAERLASSLPFSVDTLSYDQWLQWTFIPRMVAIIEHGAELPSSFSIAPMGEEAFAYLGRGRFALIEILQRIDRLASKLG